MFCVVLIAVCSNSLQCIKHSGGKFADNRQDINVGYETNLTYYDL